MAQIVSNIFPYGIVGVSLAGILFAAVSLFGSAIALRAQSRAHFAVLAHAERDEHMRAFLRYLQESNSLSPEDVEKARQLIKASLDELPSRRDRIYVSDGINQSNTVGAQRYIHNVLNAA